MRMNEGFFGQYSVFCVFGSVVGCVVVPLIAQVLQQQSMECVILSAIVISLTAAHLNKKGGNDATASYSKIVMASDLERKKTSHSRKVKTQHHKQQQHQQGYQQMEISTGAEQVQLDLEDMQHEVSKTNEIERRAEEKRLKKLRKREERLKKREEVTKKEKELEEHCRTMREKRVKHHKETCYHLTQRNYVKSAARNLDKYCGSSSVGGNSENKRTYGCRVQTPSAPAAMKLRMLHSNSTPSSYYQQKIPRFERSRAGMESNNHGSLPLTNTEAGVLDGCERIATLENSPMNNLTIKCNLSASCSSLSSISSLSSGSASPPMSAGAYKSNTAPWSMTTPLIKQMESSPPPSAANNQSLGQWHPCVLLDDLHVGKCDSGKKTETSLKSYSSKRVLHSDAVIAPKFISNSSSLFCSQLDGKVDTLKEGDGQSHPIAGSEYSLFGPRGFVTSLAR